MRTRTLLALAAAALALTLASVRYQRVGPLKRVEGEGFCRTPEPCEVPALGGGFPLAWMVDDPQVSVPNAISPFEDEFRPFPFAVDFLFFLVLALGAARLARTRYPRHPS